MILDEWQVIQLCAGVQAASTAPHLQLLRDLLHHVPGLHRRRTRSRMRQDVWRNEQVTSSGWDEQVDPEMI